jgi:hypothetical protein
LLNYYLFAGGHNPLLDVPVGDASPTSSSPAAVSC